MLVSIPLEEKGTAIKIFTVRYKGHDIYLHLKGPA